MRFKIDCDSPLLQSTLEYFLNEYLDENGIIITDNPEKEGVVIGKDIKKPFSKASLIMQLEKKYSNNKEIGFEEKFEEIFDKFKKELLQTIKDYYGKK